MTRFSGLRVLLVEDNEINQMLAAELLEETGASVDLANDGREAVEMVLGGEDYHLVLMDLLMPEMDGYQATALVRADPRFARLPIIAMTGKTTPEERQRCLNAGMNDHVAKPIEPEQLFATLSRYYKADAPSDTPPRDTEGTIPAIEGLDTQAALARVGGNGELYVKLLHRFLDQESAPAHITESLARGDWLAAERLAHTVNGVSASLGAGAVQRAAANLEAALQAHSHSDALQAEFQTTLSDFVGRLRAALPQTSTAPPDPEESLDGGKIAAIVTEMDALLGSFDAEAPELFEAHRYLFRAVLSADFSAFEMQIANFAFDDARGALRRAAARKEIPLP